ncbi:MAG TPA: DUF3800 domain-containing protein [Candidatus Angelobacter sp.]|nr:DUF3800 domain-containing protein [Candidatus Angelobacter sp.]
MIALRAYLDSSGKLENDYLTLAAVAATEQTWQDFETEWAKILDGHTPKAKYVHMREIAHQTKGFDRKLGWDDNSAFGLSNKCLIHMSRLDKLRFKMFYCAIDMRAYHKLKAQSYLIPEPIELCNQFCSEAVLMWWLGDYPKKVKGCYPDVVDPMADTISYFFDRNEYFKQPFEDKWNAEKDRADRTGEWNIWQRVKEVAAVDMRDVPGIQAADIVAWAVNRENIVKHGKKASYLAHIMRQVIPAWSVVWDEEKFKKHFTPFRPSDLRGL